MISCCTHTSLVFCLWGGLTWYFGWLQKGLSFIVIIVIVGLLASLMRGLEEEIVLLWADYVLETTYPNNFFFCIHIIIILSVGELDSNSVNIFCFFCLWSLCKAFKVYINPLKLARLLIKLPIYYYYLFYYYYYLLLLIINY
jgi:hypothetical protein